MSDKERMNSIINTHNSIIKYFDYIKKQNYNDYEGSIKDPLNEDDIYRVIFSFIQLDLLLKMDNIIKRVGGKLELYISEMYLDTFLSTIAKKENNGKFSISNVIESKKDLITLIRHKLAHADYYYSSEKRAVILIKKKKDIEYINNEIKKELLNKYSSKDVDEIIEFMSKQFNESLENVDDDEYEMEIGIDMFINFYDKIQEDLYSSFNQTEFTRNLIVNKVENIKVLETEQDVLDFLKLFTYKKYILISDDGKEIMPGGKEILNIFLSKMLYNEFNINDENDIKNVDENIIKIIESIGYKLKIENNKITDKETIDKLVKALLLIKVEDKSKVNKDILLNKYENIVNKILDNRYETKGIDKGIFTNIKILKNLLSMNQTERTELLSYKKEDHYAQALMFNDYEEMASSIMLALFMNIYGYPLENIFKKDKNYSLDRSEYLDFGKLDLTGFNPNILENNKTGITNKETEINSKIKSIKKTKEKFEFEQDKYNDLITREKLTEGQKKGLKHHEKNKNMYLRNLIKQSNELSILELEKKEIEDDYNQNSNYFKNREIIEGIRNSLFHGGAKVLNFTQVDNIKDLVFEFTNNHQNKTKFQMNLDISTFNKLFEPHNMKVIEQFKNDKVKVLKK